MHFSRSCHSSQTVFYGQEILKTPQSRSSSCQSQGRPLKMHELPSAEGKFFKPDPRFQVPNPRPRTRLPGLKCKVQQLWLLHSTRFYSTPRLKCRLPGWKKRERQEQWIDLWAKMIGWKFNTLNTKSENKEFLHTENIF